MPPPCSHCGRADHAERRHIGKSSGGWCFSLHVYPEEGIHTMDDWRARWSNGEIRDEYGDVISPAEMEDHITKRNWPFSVERQRTATFMRQNHAEHGPNNLLRHQIGNHCIGHGEGTWDYIVGEFS